MKFLRTIFLALSLVLLAAQPVAALVMSDGSSGVFRPTADFTLDLSGVTVPQYSSIYIDAGIKLTILTPTGGVFGNLLAANDIFVDGIIDAGSGSLGLQAGNQIMLGIGSQLIAGSISLVANLNADSFPSISPSKSERSGVIIALPGADVTPIGATPIEVLPNSQTRDAIGGIITVGGGDLNNGGDGAVVNGGVTIRAVSAPSSILLLLPGLAFLSRRSWRRAG